MSLLSAYPRSPLLLDRHALLDHVLHQIRMLVREVRDPWSTGFVSHERLEEERVTQLPAFGHCGGRLPPSS
jgi:hypothetical protein